MIDGDVQHPCYRETKEIVDELLPNTMFEGTETTYHGTGIAWVEALRIFIASYLASSATRQRTRKNIEARIDPRGVQAFLTWAKAVVTTGWTSDWGKTFTEVSRYEGPYGLKNTQNLDAPALFASITGKGGHTIYYDRFRNAFSDKMPVVNDATKGLLAHNISKSIDAYSDDFPELTFPTPSEVLKSIETQKMNRSQNAHIRLRISLRDEAEVLHNLFVAPYSLEGNLQFADDVRRRAEATLALAGFQAIAQQMLTEAELPTEMDPRISFHTSDDEQHLRSTLYLEFTQYDNRLNEQREFYFLGLIDHPRGFLQRDVVQECFQKGRNGTQPLPDAIVERLRIEKNKFRRRKTKAEARSQSSVKIDKVAAFVLDIVRQHKPHEVHKIFRQRTKSIHLPVECLGGFASARASKRHSNGKRRAEERITFHLKEGEVRVRLHLSEDVWWDKTRLRVPRLPTAVLTTLPGRTAREIVDHPIADFLGPVQKAYPGKHTQDATYINFHPLVEEIPIDS